MTEFFFVKKMMKVSAFWWKEKIGWTLCRALAIRPDSNLIND